MSSDLAQWCQACQSCQPDKDTQESAQSFMGHLLATRANEILALEYILAEPNQKRVQNARIMTGVFSKYMLVIPTTEQLASTVVQVLVTE